MQGYKARVMQTYRAAVQHSAPLRGDAPANMQNCMPHRVQGLLAAWQSQRQNVALMHLLSDQAMHAAIAILCAGLDRQPRQELGQQ